MTDPAPGAGARARLVLFDLDGTLADTLPDLAHALARALAERGLPAPDNAALRARVSHGARAMTEFALTGHAADAGAVLERFLTHYRGALAARTRLFDGIAEVLDALERRGLEAGVVTNKPAAYSEPLLDALALRARLRCVVSGDSAARAKPHPDPLELAAREAGVPGARCVYVGDARDDVRAARAAGMPVAVAAWGYLPADDDPAHWGADRLLAHPRELLAWLDRG